MLEHTHGLMDIVGLAIILTLTMLILGIKIIIGDGLLEMRFIRVLLMHGRVMAMILILEINK
jgi:hypothetical protein